MRCFILQLISYPVVLLGFQFPSTRRVTFTYRLLLFLPFVNFFFTVYFFPKCLLMPTGDTGDRPSQSWMPKESVGVEGESNPSDLLTKIT